MTAKQKKPADSGKKIKVTLVKGLRGTIHKHRESVKGLGLRHREHSVEAEASTLPPAASINCA